MNAPFKPVFLVPTEEATTDAMTVRELFAAMAMQGLLATADASNPSHMPPAHNMARLAVEYADALIKLL
jgi:hypothetical protein